MAVVAVEGITPEEEEVAEKVVAVRGMTPKEEEGTVE